MNEKAVRTLARGAAAFAFSVASLVMVGACGDTTTAEGTQGGATTSTVQTRAHTPNATGLPPGVAPKSARVDLAEPAFSDPTSITNPLFPVTKVAQALQMGVDEGKQIRVEYTRLPGTKTIDVNGQKIETVVVQFIAYQDRRIKEVTPDYFAQADDGSVWYLGENVSDYEDGVITSHEGTWLAGKDGPPAMIMPANPKVGEVYRTENIPGLVFEEVTVKSIDQTLAGPTGPVEGVVIVEELHMEGDTEFKAFAPGYGEFLTPGENLALAVPTDALPGPPPPELKTLSTGATEIFGAAPSEDWDAISASLDTMAGAWDAYKAGDIPPLLEAQMADALAALTTAVDARNPVDARQAALGVTQATLDFRLQHRPVAEVDLARMDLWARQLLVDADDPGAVASDVAILETIWNRVGYTVDASDAERIETRLADLRAAADAKDLATASDTASALRDILVGVEERHG